MIDYLQVQRLSLKNNISKNTGGGYISSIIR